MTTTPPPDQHEQPRAYRLKGSPGVRIAFTGAALTRAAHAFDVTLTPSYAKWVAADGLAHCDRLGVTPLGDGIIIHTAPTTADQLPILLGYAGPQGEWTRTGQRWQPPTLTPAPEPDPSPPIMRVDL